MLVDQDTGNTPRYGVRVPSPGKPWNKGTNRKVENSASIHSTWGLWSYGQREATVGSGCESKVR
jgi:hypothetical protein